MSNLKNCHFKYVQFTVYQLHFNKVLKRSLCYMPTSHTHSDHGLLRGRWQVSHRHRRAHTCLQLPGLPLQPGYTLTWSRQASDSKGPAVGPVPAGGAGAMEGAALAERQPGRQAQSSPMPPPLIRRGQGPEYLCGNFPIFQCRLKFLRTCLGQITYA